MTIPSLLHTAVFLAGLGALSACSPVYRDTDVSMRAQTDFEVGRYLGLWFEIARFPVPFQRGCTATTATYGTFDADTVSVVNTCRIGSPNGPKRQITGQADVVAPGKLSVRFGSVPFVRAPYWVLWVDDRYDIVVVGVPNGRAGWILARSPMISSSKRAQAEAALRQNGYDPAALIDVPHGPIRPQQPKH